MPFWPYQGNSVASINSSLSRSGFLTGSFRYLQQRDVLVVNPYTRTEMHVSGSTTSYSSYRANDGRTIYVNGLGYRPMNAAFQYTAPTSDQMTVARNVALNSVNKHTRGEVSQILPILGELNESLTMISHGTKSIRDVLVNTFSGASRRGDYFKYMRGMRKAQALQMATDLWLEVQFGVRPFVHDVQSGAELLAALSMDVIKHSKVTGSYHSTEQHVYTGQGSIGYLGAPVYFTGQVEMTYGYKFGYTPTSDIASVQPSAQTLAGANWQDALPALWELLPYSFVVDYFSNVGNIFAALATIIPSHRLAYENYRSESVLNWSHVTPAGSYGGFAGSGQKESGTITWLTFTRQTWNAYQNVPRPSFKLPGLEQGANLLALGAQTIRLADNVNREFRSSLSLDTRNSYPRSELKPVDLFRDPSGFRFLTNT